jgi:type IV pilus assembly protein PilB
MILIIRDGSEMMASISKKETNIFHDFDYDNEPIVDLVNDIIHEAVAKRASDIHFDPTPDYLNIRIRIDGELVRFAEVPNTVKKNLATRVKIISGMNITETRLPQDGAIKMEYDGKPLDMRVSALPIVDGEKIVVRILDYSRSLEGLEALGFTDDNLEKVKRMISAPNGIILVTGATGSGKSTTVYSMLQRLNKESTNIITVEDPVEMKIPGLNQVQVMSDIGLTFASALRSILRQDPDIIMIGEIRDDETARIAVRASITGHLVLSTIHTNNSLNTIERLTDMDVERYLLGTALMGIISQRLAKKLCPKCRKARPVTKYEKIVFKKALNLDVKEIYEPVGCKECIKGYLGRIPIHEVLEITQDIRDAIVNNMRKDELRNLVYNKSSVKSILQDGLMKVVNGLTSFEEILRIIDVDEDFGDDDKELKAALLGKYQENEQAKKENDYEVLDL